ncbi:hypothetical protein GGR52DRAFT_592093 [Hypoxylon sp. FL1284]|nr:hypothetical protein GGR52DRAFT_592093 [Hypoxylon sp. FL1284]
MASVAREDSGESSAEEPVNILDDSVDELRQLQRRHAQIRTYLAIVRDQLEQSKQESAALGSEGWVSRRKRHGFESKYRQWERKNAKRAHRGWPLLEPLKRYNRAAIDKKIRSYKKAIKRSSVQLLLAAAGTSQHREVNLATRQGKLIKGVDPGVPRSYRALDTRRPSSLSSNEAVARTIRNVLDKERARRLGREVDSDDRVSLESDSSDDSGNGSGDGSASEGEAGAQAKMAGAVWGSEKSSPHGSGASRSPNGPAAPDPNMYNPRRWPRLVGSYFDQPDRVDDPYEQPRDTKTPTGWLTWKEQHAMYPTFDKVAKIRQLRPEDVWDPNARVLRELNIEDRGKRPRLEPDIITKLSLERGYGAEHPQMNTLYEEYSRIPLIHDKPSDEVMRKGPLPKPPKLPLKGPMGPEIKFNAEPSSPDRTENWTWKRRWEQVDPDSLNVKLPAPKFEYAPDHPATSTFKFASGKSVADIFKPSPRDEPDQIHATEEVQEHGRQLAQQERLFKAPYRYAGMDPQPQPQPRATTRAEPARRPLTAEQEAEIDAQISREQRRVSESWEQTVRNWATQAQAQKKKKKKKKSNKAAADPAAGPLAGWKAEAAEAAVPGGFKRREEPLSFHHYEKLADNSSSVHKGLDDTTWVPPQGPPQPAAVVPSLVPEPPRSAPLFSRSLLAPSKPVPEPPQSAPMPSQPKKAVRFDLPGDV